MSFKYLKIRNYYLKDIIIWLLTIISEYHRSSQYLAIIACNVQQETHGMNQWFFILRNLIVSLQLTSSPQVYRCADEEALRRGRLGIRLDRIYKSSDSQNGYRIRPSDLPNCHWICIMAIVSVDRSLDLEIGCVNNHQICKIIFPVVSCTAFHLSHTKTRMCRHLGMC